MTKLSDKIYLGFDKGVALESIRQWIVLLGIIGLLALYSVNVYQLYKRYYRINFELIILSSSILRLLLVFLHEFIFPDIFIIFVSLCIHTIVMMFVFYKLAIAVFQITDKRGLTKKCLLPYLIVNALLLLANIIHSLADGDALSCESHSFSLHWYVNSVVSIGNVCLGFFLLRSLNTQQRYSGSIVSSSDLLLKNQYNTIKLQMKILIWTCLIFSVLEICLIVVGSIELKDHLVCIANRFYVPNNSAGAIYLIIRSAILIGPTIGLWFVSYLAPNMQKKVITMHDKDNHLIEKIRIEEEEEDDYGNYDNETSLIISNSSHDERFENSFEQSAKRYNSTIRYSSMFKQSDVKSEYKNRDSEPVKSHRDSM